MVKRKFAKCWEKLEKFNNEKYPDCVKSLLQQAAYNTLGSLKRIDEAKIGEIEAYLSENQSSWISDLSCCHSEDYKKQTTFHFLPGHKSILRGIADQIKQMNELKKTATEAKGKKKELTDDELKEKLISNLVKNAAKKDCILPPGIITTKNIRNFDRDTGGEFVCKCKFACPFCSRVIPVQFKEFWMSSNITSHMKKHIEDDQNVEIEENV